MAEARCGLGLILAAVLLAGCGYSTRGSLPDHIKTGEVVGYSLRLVLNVEFRDVRKSAMLWREEGLQETAGQLSDTIARGQGAGQQAAAEIGRKVVNLAVDRF